VISKWLRHHHNLVPFSVYIIQSIFGRKALAKRVGRAFVLLEFTLAEASLQNRPSGRPAAPPSQVSPSSVPPSKVPPSKVDVSSSGVRHRAVLFYIAISLALLIPGLVLKLAVMFDSNLALAGPMIQLQHALADIRFGQGLRFWLGVSGASMMALLLLYPVRKAFSQSRHVGSVGAWFHLHLVFGFLGPVLVLYHCNFGLGGLNANVALWSMGFVVLSGLVGHFVYARVSRDFYVTKQQAIGCRDVLFAALPELDRQDAWRRACIAQFEMFETGLLTPRQGIAVSIVARWTVERFRRAMSRTLAAYIELWAQSGAQPGAGAGSGARDGVAYQRLRQTTARHVHDYFRVARAAATQSLREQLWARWRLFHLPVFLIMIVAGGLHVAAVWDMDGENAATLQVDRTMAELQPTSAPVFVAPKVPALIKMPQLVTARQTSAGIVKVKRVAAIDVNPKDERAPAARRAPVEQPTVAAEIPVASVKSPVVTPVVSAMQPQAVPRPALEPAMGLGAKPRTLAEQIATLKALKDKSDFAHSSAETGFSLTGRHIKVECESCHSSPLRDMRQPEPRACIACHTSDDVHRGRRPDCAQCHTTNRWSQILRRR
jgi:hypothetical protein